MPETAETSMSDRAGFILVILLLICDYGRPQDAIGAIGAIRPSLILTVLLFIAWLRARGPARGNRLPPQLWLMLLLLGLLLIHVPFATNHYLAYMTAQDFLLLLPFCLGVVWFVNTPERLATYMRWWVFLATFIALKAILHPAGSVGSSFLGDPNDVSLLLDAMVPFVVYLFMSEGRRAFKLVYLGIIVLCVAGIVSTASRGGFVGLLAVSVVLWWISPRKVLVLSLLLVTGLITYTLVDESYIDRISSIQATDEGTAKGRLDSWKAAWNMFEEHPLGVGPGNFPIRFPEYQGQAFGHHNMWGRAAHSLWFTLLAELGIPGAILYWLLLRADWRSLRRMYIAQPADPRRRDKFLLAVAFTASLVGFFAAGTFVSVLFYPHFWLLSAMIVAAERILCTGLAGAGSELTATSHAHVG